MFLEALIEYRLCLCVRRGGGFRLRGLFPRCKIHGGGGLCPCCKIHGGGLCPCCKIHGGGLCPRIQILAGGVVVRGGYCPTLSHCALKHFNAPHRESMRYLNVFTSHRCVARCVTGLSQANF